MNSVIHNNPLSAPHLLASRLSPSRTGMSLPWSHAPNITTSHHTASSLTWLSTRQNPSQYTACLAASARPRKSQTTTACPPRPLPHPPSATASFPRPAHIAASNAHEPATPSAARCLCHAFSRPSPLMSFASSSRTSASNTPNFSKRSPPKHLGHQ
jgi:hypothetical protein